MFDRRFVQYFDWGLLGLSLLLGLLGIIILYSAVTAGASNPQKMLYIKQLIWFCAGLTMMIVSLFFNYKLLERWAPMLYTVCLILLVFVLVAGKYAGGSRRWLALGPISFQPSELIKVAVIIFLSRYYASHATTLGLSFRRLIKPMVVLAIPFVLIVKQPDLGTAMLVLMIGGSITVFVKIEKRTFRYLLMGVIIAVPVVWLFLKGYQKQRILTFLNPDRDPLGTGYHIIQSKIAIGSGMMSGKGFMKGTQNALSFLPEQQTDFIFSVLAEEWGFIGSAVLILLFLMLIIWGLNVAQSCREPFGTILAFGITAMIFWQTFINIGMVMGLMPVVGVPLPFISYGGSSVLTMMISIAILMNVSMRRFMIE